MREGTTETLGAAQASHVPYLMFVKLEFVEETMYFCNAGYNFTWGTTTVTPEVGPPYTTPTVWIGVGTLGSISEIEEGVDLQMYGLTLSLSGLESSVVAKCLGTGYAGRPATVWLGLLDVDYQIIADPIVVFKGVMDTMPLKLGKDAVIQLTIESKLVNWERPYGRRYNDEDQKFEFSGDRGFEFVSQMVEKEILWGRT